jgi:hypothetical protein
MNLIAVKGVGNILKFSAACTLHRRFTKVTCHCSRSTHAIGVAISGYSKLLVFQITLVFNRFRTSLHVTIVGSTMADFGITVKPFN